MVVNHWYTVHCIACTPISTASCPVENLNHLITKKRLCFCPWFQNFTPGGMHVLNTTFFTYEAWVHLDRCKCPKLSIMVCRQPSDFHGIPLAPVWCVVSHHHIVGLFFFYETIMAVWCQLIVQDFITSLKTNERDT